MELKLTCAGATIADLISKLPATRHDLEGLILGKAIVHTRVQASDAHQASKRTDISLAIQSFVETGIFSTFYDTDCNVNGDKIKETLELHPDQVLLGFFKFRGNAPQKPSYRDRKLFKEMTKYFRHSKNAPKSDSDSTPPLIFGLFGARVAPDNIHSYDYKFFVQRCAADSARLESHRLTITNLSSESNESEYKSFDANSALTNKASSLAPIMKHARLKKWLATTQTPREDSAIEVLLSETLKNLGELSKVVSHSTAELLSEEQKNKVLLDEIAALQNKQSDAEAQKSEDGANDVPSSDEAKASSLPNENSQNNAKKASPPQGDESKKQTSSQPQEQSLPSKPPITSPGKSLSESSSHLADLNRAEKMQSNHARGSANQVSHQASSHSKRRSEESPQPLVHSRPQKKSGFFGRRR